MRKGPVNKQILTAKLEQNIKSKFSYIPQMLHSMEIISHKGPLLINSQLKSDMFNIICCQNSSDGAYIDSAIDYFETAALPVAWWVGFEYDPVDLQAKLESKEFKKEEVELAMAAKLLEIPALRNQDIIIKKVNSTELINHFTQIIGILVPEEAEAISQYFTQGSHVILHEDSRLKLFVGYLDGKPVSTSSVFLAENVAGIFDIIALPEARGKGVGSAMTLAAMVEGKNQGYDFATLMATDDAKFVYEKLGFEALKEMSVYNRLF